VCTFRPSSCYLNGSGRRNRNTGGAVALRLAKCADGTRTTLSKLPKIRFVRRQACHPKTGAQGRDRKEFGVGPAWSQRRLVEWAPVARYPGQPASVSRSNSLECPRSQTSNSLLKVLKQEREIMSSLTSLGLTPEQAVELVSHESILAAHREGGAVEGIFDASDREEGGDVIIWWNDLEKDQMYTHWTDNMHIVRMQEELNLPHELTEMPVVTSSYTPPRVPQH